MLVIFRTLIEWADGHVQYHCWWDCWLCGV